MNVKANAPCPCGSGKKYKRCCKVKAVPNAVSQPITQRVPQLYEQGKSYLETQQFQQAASCFIQAVELDSKSAILHFGLASCLIGRKELHSAVLSLEHAIQLDPDYFQAHGNLASTLTQLGRWDQAKTHYQECLRLAPSNAISHNNLGHYYCAVNAEKAASYFRQAIELEPSNQTTHSNLLYALNFLPQITAQQLYEEHLVFSRKFETVSIPRPTFPMRADSRVRIGFVSPDLRNHAVANFVKTLFQHFDRQRFDFVAYHNHADEDKISKDLSQYTLYWRNITYWSDSDALRQIQKDQIDVLIDLTGHTAHNRLSIFMQRAAPVQISWLGYPCTTGLRCMDYYFTDDISDTGNDQAYYCEQLIYLQSGICSYSPPINAPDVQPLPALRNGYITFGSLNALCKLNDRVLDLWAKVLRTVTDSQLLIYRDRMSPQIARSILSHFSSRGIDTQRIECRQSPVDQRHYLSTYADIDIHLDPMPWNSHTTACEALWMGVPSLTLKGNRHASRMCTSVMHHANLSEYIAEDSNNYLEICQNVADDIDSLSTLRSSLRQKLLMTQLMQGESFAIDFLDAISNIISKHKTT